MKELRYIELENSYADFSISISPAIEYALERGEAKPAVVLDIFGEDSITSGFLDDPEKSLNLEYCRQRNIIVRRRQNSGGAIYAPKGSAFLALYVNTTQTWVPLQSIQEAFEVCLSALSDAVREIFGIEANYRPLNDIEVEGKKLVASSARLENGVLTVRMLINVVPIDVEILKKAIITPPEKIQDKKISDTGRRYTCLQDEVGRAVSPHELRALTEISVRKIFGKDIRLTENTLTEVEQSYAQDYRKKYIADEWFYANSERIRFKGRYSGSLRVEARTKAVAGLIRVTLLISEATIKDIIITGDFHPAPYRVVTDMENALRGKQCDIKIIGKVVEEFFKRPDVEMAGIEPEDFLEAFNKAFAEANINNRQSRI